MSVFQGLGIAMVSPFCDDIEGAVQKLINHYGECADALIVGGTTGEASTMTTEEKVNLVRLVKKHATVPVIVGAGSNCTATACDNAKRYADLGADALLVVTPYYNKCTQDGLVEHYGRICEQGLDVIAYNVPSRTGVNILPATAFRLADIDHLAGLKEASGDFAQMMETLRLTEGKIDLYCGDDDLNVPAILMGYSGTISVCGNVAPKITYQAVKEAQAKNAVIASAYRHLLAPLIKALFCEVNPIPTKAALNLMGIEVGAPRLPLTEMRADNLQILKKRLMELELL
ncbi:MAG: 4-hydroxy-tetrahydrodipicolinate synthase [Clostridia bacterium]|nr:4-hydroxy-tetrahydrodipicolinate synthase [Clostridia bacterium]